MTPEQLEALAPFIAVVVFLVIGIPYFRKGYRDAKERQKRQAKKEKSEASDD